MARRRPVLSGRWRRLSFSETMANPGARLYAIVLGAGLLGGCIGAAYLAALHLLQRVLWPTHSGLLAHGILLVVVGVLVGVLTRALGSPGDVELLVDNIHVAGGAEDLKQLPSLIPISLLCVATGGGLGPEAPLVQTTGTVGSWAASRMRLDAAGMRVVTITGMAAGFTVLFGAPLGSALFALEILHRRGLEYYEALMPAVLGSLTGYGIYVLVSGAGIKPVWTLPPVGTVHHADLLWALGCGVVGALIATSFTYLNQLLRALFRRVPPLWRPPIAGLALALLACASPYALTFGEAQLGHVVTSDLALRTLLLAVVAKLLGSSVTLSGGWKGGFIIPLFFMGACLGEAGHILFPSTNQAVLIAALMAACNVGVTKTPLGSVLVVTEMAGLRLLPTTLIASVVALILTSNIGLIDSQRRRADTVPLEDEASDTDADERPG
ncbi:MAG: chloride channel protein [Acidimicrobiia bacterium]|nr:chloride channel protein [Acidimicrobiia bacterium]